MEADLLKDYAVYIGLALVRDFNGVLFCVVFYFIYLVLPLLSHSLCVF